jgi:hypothetical protein
MITVKSGIVVWVDVDEVLVSFRKMFHKYIRDKYKIAILDDFIPNDWIYSEVFKTKEKFNEAFEALPKDWPKDLEIYSGALSFINELKSLNCRVVLITHLPTQFSPERIENLVRHNIDFDEIYFTYGRDKTEYSMALEKRYQNEKGNPVTNLFIDDKALNVEEFLDRMPNVNFAVTLNQRFNNIDIKRMKSKYNNSKLNCESLNQQEMFDKILKRVQLLTKK